jgi:hypothetical protein
MPSRCSFLLLLFTVVALTVNAVRVAAASDITPASPEATTQPATTAPAAPATQLTHPGTKSFSLLRSSGGNTKATMLAAAGNKNAQRLLRVQAHTAKVEAEYRRMNPMAVDHITFSDGCPFSDFLVPTLVGSTVAHLLIDTGSATLALAGQQCANCQGVTPLWQQTNTATNQNIAADGTYGDGSGWVGNIWSDRVAFADATTSQPVTAYVQTNVVVMTSQSKNGVDASGNSNPNSRRFTCTRSQQQPALRRFGR